MAPVDRLEIPPWQNHACLACGACCRRGFEIWVPEPEKARLEETDWAAHDPALAGRPLFRRTPRGYRIDLDATGACRYLAPDNLCRMHGVLGFEKKPLTCKQFPLVFGSAPGVRYVGVLFSCPSICRNEGKPLARQKSLARDLLAERVRFFGEPNTAPTRLFDAGRTMPVQTLRALEEALVALIGVEESAPPPLVQGMFRAAAMLEAVEGMTSVEWERTDSVRAMRDLRMEAAGTAFEPGGQGRLPARERMLFRQVCGLTARSGEAALLSGNPFRRFGARVRRVWVTTRYLLGTGFPAQRGMVLDGDPRTEDLLRRYVSTRIWTRTYLGAEFAGLRALEGLRVTLLTVPLALWHAREAARVAGHGEVTYGDICAGVVTVDLTFGHRPDLGGTTARVLRTLCAPRIVRRCLVDLFPGSTGLGG